MSGFLFLEPATPPLNLDQVIVDSKSATMKWEVGKHMI